MDIKSLLGELGGEPLCAGTGYSKHCCEGTSCTNFVLDTEKLPGVTKTSLTQSFRFISTTGDSDFLHARTSVLMRSFVGEGIEVLSMVCFCLAGERSTLWLFLVLGGSFSLIA